MTRLYGRAPQGKRLVDKVPHGHWKTTTFICGLRYDGVTAPFVLDGPMDGPHFLAYVEQILAPTLKKGQIVFLDNVSTHKVDGIEEAIAARGACAVFLPAYSPDLNPIEQLFARLKSFLRKMKARTVEQLWRAIASFLKGVSKEECKAYLANSGYTYPSASTGRWCGCLPCLINANKLTCRPMPLIAISLIIFCRETQVFKCYCVRQNTTRRDLCLISSRYRERL